MNCASTNILLTNEILSEYAHAEASAYDKNIKQKIKVFNTFRHPWSVDQFDEYKKTFGGERKVVFTKWLISSDKICQVGRHHIMDCTYRQFAIKNAVWPALHYIKFTHEDIKFALIHCLHDNVIAYVLQDFNCVHTDALLMQPNNRNYFTAKYIFRRAYMFQELKKIFCNDIAGIIKQFVN
jgi:hypothetical protein